MRGGERREEGSWEKGRGGGGEEKGILYNMILFESSRDTRTGYPGYSGDGFDGERKRENSRGKEQKRGVQVVCPIMYVPVVPGASISSFSNFPDCNPHWIQSGLCSFFYFIFTFFLPSLPHLALLL